MIACDPDLDQKLTVLYNENKTPERDALIADGEELWGVDILSKEYEYWTYNVDNYLRKIPVVMKQTE